MPEWLQELISGWPMIKANIPIFIVILALMIGVIWGVMNWTYGAIIASKSSQIELLQQRVTDYEKKLNGASPDQARQKIESLERTVRATIGSQWTPLNTDQIAALSTKLRTIKKSRAQIMYENALGKELAQNIFAAFKAAGWDEATFGTGSGLGEGIVVGWSSRAEEVKTALEVTANLPVWAKDTEKEISDLVIVGVGINVR